MRFNFGRNIHGSRGRSILYAFIVLFNGCLFQGETWGADAPSETLAELVARQLIVIFDVTNSSSPSTKEIINAAKTKVENASLHSILGTPSSAYKLLNGITPLSIQDELAKYPLSARARLEQYIVLTYPTAADASNAKALLSKNSLVLSVEQNHLSSVSAAPNDRFFAINPSQPDPGNYQWGMQILNLPTAWDKARGTAYLGTVDKGIVCPATTIPCITHPDLQHNFRHQFSQSFYSGALPDNQVDESNYLYNGYYKLLQISSMRHMLGCSLGRSLETT